MKVPALNHRIRHVHTVFALNGTGESWSACPPPTVTLVVFVVTQHCCQPAGYISTFPGCNPCKMIDSHITISCGKSVLIQLSALWHNLHTN